MVGPRDRVRVAGHRHPSKLPARVPTPRLARTWRVEVAVVYLYPNGSSTRSTDSVLSSSSRSRSYGPTCQRWWCATSFRCHIPGGSLRRSRPARASYGIRKWSTSQSRPTWAGNIGSETSDKYCECIATHSETVSKSRSNTSDPKSLRTPLSPVVPGRERCGGVCPSIPLLAPRPLRHSTGPRLPTRHPSKTLSGVLRSCPLGSPVSDCPEVPD